MLRSGRLGVLLATAAAALAACGHDPSLRPSGTVEAPADRESVPPQAPAPPAAPEGPQAPPPREVRPAVDGIYLLDTGALRVALTLERDGSFQITTTRRDPPERRVGAGTWALKGTDLTLTYRTLDGESIEEQAVLNRLSGDRIVLDGQGRAPSQVLTRKSMFRTK